MTNEKNDKIVGDKKIKKWEIILIIIVLMLLLLVSLLTKFGEGFLGIADAQDYTDTAKFFAGEYQAKLRTAHTVLYSVMNVPLLKIGDSFKLMKLASVFWLILIILSLYYLSGKNKNVLFLILSAPIIWYLAPIISPIPIASLLFLWGYYFLKKYDDSEEKRLKILFYSGLLFGLAWAFWVSIFYFAIPLAIIFLYDKKLYHSLFFILAVFIGLLPTLIVDQIIYGFAFYSLLKHFFAILAFTFASGIYGQSGGALRLSDFLFFVLMIPLVCLPVLFTKKNFKENWKTTIFILFSIFTIIVANSAIRYSLIIVPIIILSFGKRLSKKQFLIQTLIFMGISLLVINPYLIQISYSINNRDIDFEPFTIHLLKGDLKFNSEPEQEIVLRDLRKIEERFPDEIFVVGNIPDAYQKLAHTYWDEEIKEFVSIQDYKLYLENKTEIAGRRVCTKVIAWNRRDLCVKVSLNKAFSDETAYGEINYGIVLNDGTSDEILDLENFKLLKKYERLSVFEKID